MRPSIEVTIPGWATTIQDGGRGGLAHLGIPTSGAVDPGVAGLVNRLVGNADGAAVLETCGGLTIRALESVVVAGSVEAAPVALGPGQSYTLGRGGQRMWHYLAIRGGIDVIPVLGSRSTDTLSGFGPVPVRRGAIFSSGAEPVIGLVVDVAPLAEINDRVVVTRGPRHDWLEPGWEATFSSADWVVGDTSRVGVRLSGPTLPRLRAGELPSEGLVRGAVQALPDGDLVMMLSDHPTTGGYPVIAVVDSGGVADVAQHRSGLSVRFRIRD
jgi:biotin-dependent carboxylase-like uncharacterized protein